MSLIMLYQNLTQLTLTNRRGVSLVEVLFAMMIALFGLAGVLAIFPLAARQAADSYSLNQATNGAMSIAAASAAAKDILPSETAPWVCDDDYTTSSPPAGTSSYEPPFNNYSGFSYKPFRTFADLYIGLVKKRAIELYGTSYTAAQLAISQRQVVGQGFCYDPLYMSSVNQTYWTAQGKPWTDYAGASIIRRSRMPHFSETIDPTMFDGSGNLTAPAGMTYLTPRLIRTSSLANLNPSLASAAMNMASANARVGNIGDLIPASIQTDKSFGALREFNGVDQGSLLSAGANGDLSWFATIVPMESKSLEYPTQFTVSIVVIKKRDRTFDVPDGSAAITVLPESERLAIVTSLGSTPDVAPGLPPLPNLPFSNGSLLSATLHFDSRSQSTLRVGDYVMLSRNVLWALPDYATNGARFVNRHAWYRVVAVGERVDSDLGASTQLSRDVVLQGRPWDYPDLNPSLNSAVALSPPYARMRTVATVVENVVAVYEYPINITE